MNAIIKGLMSSAGSFLGGIQAYLIVGALSAVVASGVTYKVMHNASLASQASAAKETVHLVVHQGQINMQLGDIVLPKLAAVQDNTSRIQQEISQYVTPQIDHDFSVPLGFVRVFNDASHGAIPAPAAGGDADPSGVRLSAVARAHAADEGTLDQCRLQLTTWWAWYDQQSAAWNKGARQ